MPDQINARRRRLLGTTLAGISMMELGLSGLAHAQSGPCLQQNLVALLEAEG